MNIREIKKYVNEHYDELPLSKFTDGDEILAEGVAIWGHDACESYSTDVEVILLNKRGRLHWAYASGCSCYCSVLSEYIESRTFKKFLLDNDSPALDKVLDFWKDGVPKIESYEESEW